MNLHPVLWQKTFMASEEENIKAKHSIFLKHKTMRKQKFLIPNHFAIFKLKNVFLKISFKKTFKVLYAQKKSLISW